MKLKQHSIDCLKTFEATINFCRLFYFKNLWRHILLTMYIKQSKALSFEHLNIDEKSFLYIYELR